MSVHALIFTEVMQRQFGYSRALGAYRIATEIRNAGYTCQVVDFFTKFTDEELDKIISSFVGPETLFVGFSSTFFEYVDEQLDVYQQQLTGKEFQAPGEQLFAIHYPYHRNKMNALFDKIKAINPKVKIVLGGAKTRSLFGPCDAYAVGYCDKAIVGYMKFLEGKNPFFQYEKVNDQKILFFGENNERNFDFSTTRVEWHETDYIIPGESLPVEIARGCIFKCKFCSYPLNGKNKLDFIKNDNILRDEFLRNYNEFGVTRYIYADDTHNDSIEKLERIHKIVTSLPFEIEYAAYLRHDLIHAHKHTADLLRESGLRSAIFGIETLNHASGKAIGKGLDPEKIKDLLYWLKNDKWKNEVATTSGFIVGLPYDTRETILEWSKWILNPDCPLDSYQFEPLYIADTESRGKIWKSEFELNAEKYGYRVGKYGYWENDDFTSVTAAALAKELVDIGTKTDRNRCAGFPLIMLANLGYKPKELIGTSRLKAFASIKHRRPAYIGYYKERLLKQINYEISI